MRLYRDRLFLVFSVLSAAISFVIYNITKAPTVSFWDCGEFIASSYILGVPHPPGYPVYVILGRLMSMLPLSSEIAVRVNLLSVLGGAAAVFVAYWLIVRIIVGPRDTMPEGRTRLAIATGALAGSLIMGFSYTFWSNAVEAEVYTLSMFLMLLVNVLALLWAHNYEWKGRDRLLILISYLLWLSLGIHMTTFIVLLPMIFFLAYNDYLRSRLIRWPVWLVLGLFVLYAVPLHLELLLLLGIDLSRYELEIFIALFSIAIIVTISVTLIKRIRESGDYRVWWLAASLLLAAVAGFSSQAYLPVRATGNPAINENDPDSWARFKGLLERKQYGKESMIRRMFKRRGSWQRQLFSDPRFGLWATFSEQYASPRAGVAPDGADGSESRPSRGRILLVFPVLFVLIGLFGAYWVIMRAPPEGLFVAATFVLCTLGMVIYMNFSDGSYNTVIAPVAEVRNRDYFFTPGFMYFAIMIGLGLTYLLEKAARLSSSMPRSTIKNAFFYAVISVALLLPVVTAASNFHRNDRRGNYLPRDYAFNILNSCDRDAILFTNGDNDTFPLWYIQLVEGVRTDVRVVNLSLLNTPWYIRQLRDEMAIPVGLEEQEIDGLQPIFISDRNQVWRVQDQMVQHIITSVQREGWKVPVYFAITVPSRNRPGLDDHLIMEGMAYRVVESSGENRVDTEIGYNLFTDQSRFRGIIDASVRKDENDRRLITNYVIAMLQLADTYQREGHPDSAATIAECAVAMLGDMDFWQAKALLASIYAELGRIDDIVDLARGSSQGEMIFLAASQDLITNLRYEDAARLLKLTLEEYPKSLAALNNLVAVYDQQGDSATADSIIDQFRTSVSGDSVMLQRLDQMIQRLDRSHRK
jgi:tetratricopeptide (TPR) repeat protein